MTSAKHMEHCEQIRLLSQNCPVATEDDANKRALTNFWKRIALALLTTSVVIQLGLGAAILVFALKENTPGGLGLGIDVALDVLTTVIVIWKHCCMKNEASACLIIAILFIISGIALNIKAIYNLSKEWAPYFKPNIMLPIESTIFVSFGILMTGKIYVSKKLNSRSLFVDGVNTGCGLILAAMNLVSLLVYKKTNLWFLDSVTAIVISLFLVLFGVSLMLSSLNATAKEANKI